MSGSFSDWCPSLNWCCGVVFVLFFSFFILRISSFLLFQTVLGSALFPASFIVCLFVRAKHLHVTRGKRGDLIRLLVNRLRRWSWRPHRAHYSGTRWLHRCIISGISTTADGVMGPGCMELLRAPNLITIWKCRFIGFVWIQVLIGEKC